MDRYVTGAIIKKLREERKMTQSQLAEKLNVSDKTVSKWETGKGYPDISILENLASVLEISLIELMSGNDITNSNRSFNMKRGKWHVCPVCGNVIYSTGEAVMSCHGITLPALDAEPADEKHEINIEISEDEYYVTLQHEMSKEHYISFAAGISDNGMQLCKLYPEGPAEARFKISRTRYILFYCNRDGLFSVKVPSKKQSQA